MTNDVRQRIAKNLKKYRDKFCISQEALSLELDLNVSYIGKVENAKMNISLDKLSAIAQYFNIDVIDLLKK